MAACAQSHETDTPIFHLYWRAGTFDLNDDSTREWYSAQLCAMGEPDMTAPLADGVRVRLLWLRTFDPSIAVRVEHTAAATRLVAVQLDDAGGHATGRVARRQDLVLNSDDWRTLERSINATGFWRLATRDRSNFGVDGATWLIEIVEPHRRHVVERWSHSVLEPLGRQLLVLSKLEPSPIY